MHLHFTSDRVLAVVAHPDDAELLCAGTLARARDDGAAIGICVLCRGDKGQPPEPIANLAAVRRQEMQAAAALLGAELFAGPASDGTLADTARARRWLMKVYRRFRPTLVLAHAPEDYHPDHRAASALAEAATWFAGSAGQKTKSPPLDAPPALWWMDTINRGGFTPGFYIDITGHLQLKLDMLDRHASQLARRGQRSFAPLAELLRLQAAARGAESGVAAAEAFRLHPAFKRCRAW
jgi:LmbE family N-acetylglucosaminyl deacetylase